MKYWPLAYGVTGTLIVAAAVALIYIPAGVILLGVTLVAAGLCGAFVKGS